MARSAPKKKTAVRAFNLRGVPAKTFFRIKMAAAAEQLSARDWLLGLAEARLAELERQGKLPKDT
jgi:hypothetical protein